MAAGTEQLAERLREDQHGAGRAGTTEHAKLRDALATTKDFEGVTGKTTIDAERNATKGAVIITVKDGKFKYVKTITP